MESHDIIVQYFGGTLLTFYTESRQDDITSKNRTRFEWADEVGVVTKFSKRLFVPREFDMKFGLPRPTTTPCPPQKSQQQYRDM